jgi:hypothetical protein
MLKALLTSRELYQTVLTYSSWSKNRDTILTLNLCLVVKTLFFGRLLHNGKAVVGHGNEEMLGLGMIILGFWHYFGCVEFETLEQS